MNKTVRLLAGVLDIIIACEHLQTQRSAMLVIRVSGNHGAGKTTLCKRLAKALEYRYVSTSDFFHELAEENGLSIEEFYSQLEKYPDLEKSVDTIQKNLTGSEREIIFESRIAVFWKSPFPHVNLKLTVTPEEGARRQLRRPKNQDKTLAEMIKLSEKRLENERKHYQSLYGIEDHLADSHFTFVVDTTNLSKDAVFDDVMKRLRPFFVR